MLIKWQVNDQWVGTYCGYYTVFNMGVIDIRFSLTSPLAVEDIYDLFILVECIKVNNHH